MMIPYNLVVHDSKVRHDLDPISLSYRQDHSQNVCMRCNFSLLSWIGVYLEQMVFMTHFRACRDLDSRSYWYL